MFERSIELNPEAGYSYLQLGLLLSWEGRYADAERILKRAVELQDQFISGNAGLQVVGANARLGYVYYLQGRYEEAVHEYERGLAFVGASDHALKERTSIELQVKLGAAYKRLGQRRGRGRAVRSRAPDVPGARREGRRRSVHAVLHRVPLRAARRQRARPRFARARRRRAAGAHRRAHPPRSGSRQHSRRAPLHRRRQPGVIARGRSRGPRAVGFYARLGQHYSVLAGPHPRSLTPRAFALGVGRRRC